MARSMSDPASKLYRVVEVSKRGYTTFYGPYEHKRTAGFVKSYMFSSWDTEDIWIEETQTQWYRIDD